MVDPEKARHMAEQADIDGIIEFFDETGAVELISFLDSTGYRFEEIDKELAVSRGILNDRVAEARGLNLVKPAQSVREDQLYRVHQLTFLGEAIQEQMRDIGLTQTHERLRLVMKDFEDEKTTFSEWVANPDVVEQHFDKKVRHIANSKHQDHTRYEG